MGDGRSGGGWGILLSAYLGIGKDVLDLWVPKLCVLNRAWLGVPVDTRHAEMREEVDGGTCLRSVVV